MDIYEARNVQKVLFGISKASIKSSRTCIVDGKLAYVNSHKLCDLDSGVKVDLNVFVKMSIQYIRYRVKVQFEVVTKKSPSNVPEGLYAVEIIEID